MAGGRNISRHEFVEIDGVVRVERGKPYRIARATSDLFESGRLADHYFPRVTQDAAEFRRNPHPLWDGDHPYHPRQGDIFETRGPRPMVGPMPPRLDAPPEKDGAVVIRFGSSDSMGKEIMPGAQFTYVDWKNPEDIDWHLNESSIDDDGNEVWRLVGRYDTRDEAMVAAARHMAGMGTVGR